MYHPHSPPPPGHDPSNRRLPKQGVVIIVMIIIGLSVGFVIGFWG